MKARRKVAKANRLIALLRGINVGGYRKVPMTQLKALVEELGYLDVVTYIQSGNVVFSCPVTASVAETKLENALAKHFGFPVDVVVRTASDWDKYSKSMPFPGAARTRPHLVMLVLAKGKIAKGAAEVLCAYAKAGETIEIIGQVVWVDFPKGSGKSKLTPGIFERALGSPVTIRNWNTVQKIGDMLCNGPTEYTNIDRQERAAHPVAVRACRFVIRHR